MKSHFIFTKKQRNGIFLLVVIIVLLQIIYFFIDWPLKKIGDEPSEYSRLIREIDSLKQIEIASRQPKIYPFNPNYITDFKGYRLGMSNEEIDRLLAYRKENKWINSAEQFQEITQISDSLLNALSPYFAFPAWTDNSKPNNLLKSKSTVNSPVGKDVLIAKRDLNTATAQELQKINGVGKVLSERIVKFRNTFEGGFISDIQLQDVYALPPETIERITKEFTVLTPRKIKKLNLNNATIDELVTVQHVNYELARQIIEQRTLLKGFKNIDELLKVKNFPFNKLEIIKLYLMIEKED